MSSILQLIEANKESMLTTGCDDTANAINYDPSAPSPF